MHNTSIPVLWSPSTGDPGGSLYNATIEMSYDNTSPKCTQSLEVSCNIGQITIVQNVYTTSNECSPKIGKQTHQGNITLDIGEKYFRWEYDLIKWKTKYNRQNLIV